MREVLGRGGHLEVRAVGGSMLPAIAPGDRLVLGPLRPEGPALGEVVVWAGPGGIRAHRVVELGQATVTTRGDALPQPDPPVSRQALLGQVIVVRWSLRGRLRALLGPGGG